MDGKANGPLGEAPKPYVVGDDTDPPMQSDLAPIAPEVSKLSIDPDPYKKPENDRRKIGLIAAAIAGLLLIVGLLVLVMILTSRTHTPEQPASQSQQPQTQTPPAAQTTSNCSKNWTEFAKNDVGLRFCYPAAWGTASTRDAKIDPSDRGTRVSVVFDKKQAVRVTVVSQDWATDAQRDIACHEIAAQQFPNPENLSPKWQTTNGGQAAERLIEYSAGQFILQEDVSTLIGDTVCLRSSSNVGGQVYGIATATYEAALGGGVTTVAAHIKAPTTLISADDRADFTTMAKTIKKY